VKGLWKILCRMSVTFRLPQVATQKLHLSSEIVTVNMVTIQCVSLYCETSTFCAQDKGQDQLFHILL